MTLKKAELQTRARLLKVYVWSIPVVTLDTVAKNRLSWKACEKSQRVVSGKIQKATSNFILIV